MVLIKENYSTNTENAGTAWKMLIRTESSDFYIYFDLNFITDNIKTIHFLSFLLFRPAAHCKRKLGQGQLRTSNEI